MMTFTSINEGSRYMTDPLTGFEYEAPDTFDSTTGSSIDPSKHTGVGGFLLRLVTGKELFPKDDKTGTNSKPISFGDVDETPSEYEFPGYI